MYVSSANVEAFIACVTNSSIRSSIGTGFTSPDKLVAATKGGVVNVGLPSLGSLIGMLHGPPIGSYRSSILLDRHNCTSSHSIALSLASIKVVDHVRMIRCYMVGSLNPAINLLFKVSSFGAFMPIFLT
ncbi:hypothetical protein KP509_24G076300 [Ceratopteris richardii]|uniref:Uncharacterized protein n=1 Tax=Ceratopteris richardii TaxID=49495 RepID=A0A8T2RYP0_CERRI|nr:hypothetical protein KP509_24G076300 [Ceratopteris richardii]